MRKYRWLLIYSIWIQIEIFKWSSSLLSMHHRWQKEISPICRWRMMMMMSIIIILGIVAIIVLIFGGGFAWSWFISFFLMMMHVIKMAKGCSRLCWIRLYFFLGFTPTRGAITIFIITRLWFIWRYAVIARRTTFRWVNDDNGWLIVMIDLGRREDLWAGRFFGLKIQCSYGCICRGWVLIFEHLRDSGALTLRQELFE